MSNLQKLINSRHSLSMEEKKQLLIGLKQLKANKVGKSSIMEYEGNPAERNVVSSTFTVTGDLNSILNKYRGVQFSPKEQDAISNFKDQATPTEQTDFHVKFQRTDDFGNNSTIVIKKHIQSGNTFVFTAFGQHESANLDKVNSDEEPTDAPQQPPIKKSVPTQPNRQSVSNKQSKPMKPNASARGSSNSKTNLNISGLVPKSKSIPSLKELMIQEDPANNGGEIIVTKTITFNNEIDGANILGDFLITLDL